MRPATVPPTRITFEDTGGSGGCGTWRVLDLAANADVFTKKACDTTIELSPDPVGLGRAGGGLRAGRRPLLPELDEDLDPDVRCRVGMDGLHLDGATDLRPAEAFDVSEVAGYIFNLSIE